MERFASCMPDVPSQGLPVWNKQHTAAVATPGAPCASHPHLVQPLFLMTSSKPPTARALVSQLASWQPCCSLGRLHCVSCITFKTTSHFAPKPSIRLLSNCRTEEDTFQLSLRSQVTKLEKSCVERKSGEWEGRCLFL